MLSIESLSSEIADLATSVEFLRSVRLVVTVLAVTLAAATLVTQWMELRRSREVSTKQKALIAMKDDQLKRELSERRKNCGGQPHG